MIIKVDIPQKFEKHFNEDRFKDSLERIECDIRDDINEEHTIPVVSGLWELELIKMLIDAFKNAEPVKYVKHGEWKINCDGYYPYCSNCMSEPKGGIMTDFCPNCGADMKGEEAK